LEGKHRASSGILSGLINGDGARGAAVKSAVHSLRPGSLSRILRGALVNSAGEILGLNNAGLHNSGITFPQPPWPGGDGVAGKGHIERPYLGLGMHAVPLQESLRAKLNLKNSAGLLVVHVEPDGPADQAGSCSATSCSNWKVSR